MEKILVVEHMGRTADATRVGEDAMRLLDNAGYTVDRALDTTYARYMSRMKINGKPFDAVVIIGNGNAFQKADSGTGTIGCIRKQMQSDIPILLVLLDGEVDGNLFVLRKIPKVDIIGQRILDTELVARMKNLLGKRTLEAKEPPGAKDMERQRRGTAPKNRWTGRAPGRKLPQ